jgi:hypothetical protein
MFIFSKLTVRLIAFTLFFVGLAIVSAATADEYRTWSDSTGQHKIKAKFQAVEDGKVVLIRENGKRVKIALDKLSKEDQDFVAKQTSNPFKDEEAGADKPAEKDNKTADDNSSDSSADDGPRSLTPDWSQSQQITVLSSDSEWKVTPPSSPAADYRPRSVPLPPKRDFFDGINGLAVSRVAKVAVVGYALGGRHGRHHGEETAIRLVLCNFETGRTAAVAETSGDNMMPMALSDDGKRILMCRNDFGFGNQDRLEIWTIKGKNIVRSLKWIPYDNVGGSGRDVLWAEFLDANRLATSSRSGRIAIWNLATGQPVCHLETSDSTPALSPDRKWIAFATNDSVGLLDIAKQEVIAMQKAPRHLQWPGLAFSPSCQKIGCITHDRILVWDTATGKLEKDFGTPGIHMHGSINFPSEDCILGDHQFLVELPNQLKFWHYQGAERVRTLGETNFMAIPGDDRAGLLLATKLPHPEATAMLKKALEQPDLFVFHKGVPVKLDVSGIPDAAHQNSVKEALTKKLGAMDCEVSDSGKVDVVASVEGPKTKKVSYMHTGTYEVQEYLTKLKIVYQGQTLWESQWTNIPGIVSLGRDENMESFLRKASSSPTYKFYDEVVLPEFLQKPSGSGHHGATQTLGTSNLTASGIR